MKKKFLTAGIVLLLIITGCTDNKSPNHKKMIIAAGLPPVASIAARIAGESATVISILPQGRTPHDFTPRTETIRSVSNSRIFLSAGLPFENKIARFMKDNGKDICDVTNGIKRLAFFDGGDHLHHHHDGCTHDDYDPHVWLSPANAVIIAANVAEQLSVIDPLHKDDYQRNFEILKNELQELDRNISQRLAPHKGKTFFVYHPAFGYFADAYGLKQRAIELNGREATAVQLATITREAKKAGVSVIFVQEQFNPGSAQALARQIGGDVAPLDPLANDLISNFKKIADSLERGFESQKK